MRHAFSPSTRLLLHGLAALSGLGAAILVVLTGVLLIRPDAIPLPPAGPVEATLRAIIPLAPALAALLTLRLCITLLGGAAFTRRAAEQVGRVGVWLLVGTALGTVGLPSAQLLDGLAAGGGSVALTVSSGHAVGLTGGLLLVVLGRVLRDAAALADDAAAIV